MRKVDAQVHKSVALKHERFIACIGTDAKKAKNVIRKTARLASYYTGEWFVLYVQIPKEDLDKIALDKQRLLINNFKLATELGGSVIQVKSKNIPTAIMEQAIKMKITTVCIGKPRLTLMRVLLATGMFNQLIKKLTAAEIDIIILS